MICTKEDERIFDKNKECWICRKEFEERDLKVRDHDHYTGKFRGAAHRSCNLQYRKPNFTPVIFHNLLGYDSHLFITQLGEENGNLKAIRNNEEKYISFSKDVVLKAFRDDEGQEKKVHHEIRFLGSYKFMSASLSDLVSDLSREHFVFLKQVCGEKHELLSRKGVFPCD